MLSDALRIGRISLEVRQETPIHLAVLAIGGALIIGLGLSVLLLVASGVDLSNVFEELIVLTFFDSAGLANVLLEWGPLILVGLAAAVAFRVQFWNIGLEGQLSWGSIGAAVITVYEIGPLGGRLYLMGLFAALGGALWIVIPLVLKLKLQISEIVTTLLLNYIAALFVLNQLFGGWQDPGDAYHHTRQFYPEERLALLGWEQVHVGLIVAVGAAVVVWVLMVKSRFGAYVRLVGSNPRMALAAGVPVTATIAAAAGLSGGLSGLGGFIVAAGQEYRLTPFLAMGYGFSGIVIAFLARNSPVGVVIISFLMAGLYVAGDSLQVFYQLPAATVGLIQSIIVLCVVSSDFVMRYRLHWVPT